MRLVRMGSEPQTPGDEHAEDGTHGARHNTYYHGMNTRAACTNLVASAEDDGVAEGLSLGIGECSTKGNTG